MFEIATRNKYRFPYVKGLVTVEDLWDLSVENLDVIFKELNAQFKTQKEESLLNTVTKSKKEAELENKIEIVKHIVSVKLAEREKKAKEKERREYKQKILQLIEEKKDKALGDLSVEQLEALIKED